MQVQTGITAKKPTQALPDRMRIMREASVKEWHKVQVKRIGEGKEPLPLPITLQPIGKDMGLWPLAEMAVAKTPTASIPSPNPKAGSARKEKAKPQASPKTQPVATVATANSKAPAVSKPSKSVAAGRDKKPNAKKIIEDDLKRQVALVKAKADKAEGKAKQSDLFQQRAPVSNVAPTLDAAEQFQKAFDHFNRHLFAAKLEDCMITWESKKAGKGIALGFFAPDRWGKAKGERPVHQIALCPIAHGQRDTKLTLSTLVHEMCHQYVEQIGKGKVKPYHCKNWCKVMWDVGLEPVIVDGKGQPAVGKDGEPKKTGKNATHKILKDGKFIDAYSELIKTGFELAWSRVPDPVAPKSEKPKKPKARIKHICPKCEEYAVAKREYVLTCGVCKKKMEPEEDESDVDLPLPNEEADD